jgi:hypothetical protein
MMTRIANAIAMARRILGAHHIVMAQIERDREFREAVRRMRELQDAWARDVEVLDAEAEVDRLLAETAENRGVA